MSKKTFTLRDVATHTPEDVRGMPDHQKVLKVLDAGINGMLAKPIAPRDLYKHIHAMLAYPRPFVISKDYVGPMRERKKPIVAKRPDRVKFTVHNTARPRRARANPAFEDGILA